jgi:putative ABC transport system substrate-binding protein
MDRRAFITGVAAGLLAVPLVSRAQQVGKVWRVGLFHVGLDHVPPSLEPLRETLKTLGYEEGKNIRLDWRNLPDEEAARETAKEFVRERVDLIVAFENQTVRAAKAATTEIPVVFLHVDDPVADGFVRTLSRPGGNLTGFVTYPDSPVKRIQLFKELVPRLRRLLVLIDPDDPATRRRLFEVQRASGRLKLQLVEREAREQADLERIFASIQRGDVEGAVALSQNLQTKFTSLLIRLAFERQVALAVHRKEWVEQGGLFSYGADLASVGPSAARYIDRILKGAKPADLPVEELSQFKLVVNLKTAKSLGFTIPREMLLRADQVIR